MEFMRVYRPTALRFTRRFTRTWNLRLPPDELQSLADLALCEAAQGFRSHRNTLFSSYLFICTRRLAHRTLSEHVRQGRVQSALERTALPEAAEAVGEGFDAGSPEHLYVRAQARDRLRQALSVLDAKERDVITALYLQEVTVSDLARMRGCSRMYLYTVRQRALARLRDALATL
jgi:RNA polymerase sigma factor (sigma-70 family)